MLEISQIKNLNPILGYYYWVSKSDIQKLSEIKNDECYLPCYPYDPNEIRLYDFDKLVGVDVLVFMNKPKIIYGTLRINSVLINENTNNKEFEYLEASTKLDLDLEKFSSNKFVLEDREKYLRLINIFNLADIPGLFFIRFDKMLTFEYQISLNEFNSYLKENLKQNYTSTQFDTKFEFKYPRKINEKNITKAYSINLLTPYLQDYLNNLNNLSVLKKNSCTISSDTVEYSESDETVKIDKSNISVLTNLYDNFVNFEIPVLLNGCNIIKDGFDKLTIKKKILLEHFEKCPDCEVVNNNDKDINLKQKKIVIKKILNKKEFEIFDNIIHSYQNVDKFLCFKTNGDFSFEKEKINIVLCSQSSSPYSKCVFILA